MADPRMKQLKIKTGVVKRLTKEKLSYVKECEDIAGDIEKMKSNNEDAYMIKKREEILSESKAMIPDCLRRLATALDDLKKIIENETDMSESEEYKLGQTVISDAEAVMDSSE